MSIDSISSHHYQLTRLLVLTVDGLSGADTLSGVDIGSLNHAVQTCSTSCFLNNFYPKIK